MAEALASDDIVSYEPATGAELWRHASTQLEPVMAAARGAWAPWAAGSLAVRVELVRRFANELLRNADQAARLIAQETGKPLWEALAEVEAGIARTEVAIRAHSERAPQRRMNNGLAGDLTIRHKPHGVVVVLGAWPQPLLMPLGHILPALIAGNAVVFKPSGNAPACGELLVRLLHTAGIGEQIVQVAYGGGEAGLALAMHDEADVVVFSGSPQAGIALNRKLSTRPDRLLTLEMGGNNPLMVWDTPLIEDAAVLVVQSAFGGAGQRPTSARRLIVAEKIYDPLMAAVRKLADRIIIGAPFDQPAPFMGPLIDMASADGIADSFVWLMSNGGTPLRHMVRPREGLPFVTPGIVDVTAMAERPDIELFGPLLQVIKVADFDEGISIANATRFGLVAGLIGGTPKQYSRFWAGSRAGIVTWNRPTTAELGAAPVGGIGLSGNHRAGGLYAPDYCAYPVATAEVEQPRASVGVGFSA